MPVICSLRASRTLALPSKRSAHSFLQRTSNDLSALRGRSRSMRVQALPDKPDADNSAQRGENVALEGTVQLRATQPVVLPLFMFANLAVYGIGVAIALLIDGETSNNFFFAFANMNDEVASGQYYRIVTATFMHAGLLHLASNSLALWYIGLEAEAVYGYSYFAAIYLLSGISGNVASFMLDDLVTVGASGAIFGLLGAIAAYFFRNPNLEQSRMQLVFLFGLVTFNIALGTVEGSLVDNTGHIAGFLSGLWLGWNTCPVWQVIPSAGNRVNSPLEGSSTQPPTVVIRTKGPEDEPDSAESKSQTTGSFQEATAAELSHSTPGGEPQRAADSSATAQDTTSTTASPAAASTANPSAAQEAQPVSDAAPSEAQKSISLLDALVPDPEGEKKAAEAARREASDAERSEGVDAQGTASVSGAVGSEVATPEKEVKIRDVSRGAVGLSVLLSFAVSLGALTWAGVVVRSMEKGL